MFYPHAPGDIIPPYMATDFSSDEDMLDNSYEDAQADIEGYVSEAASAESDAEASDSELTDLAEASDSDGYDHVSSSGSEHP